MKNKLYVYNDKIIIQLDEDIFIFYKGFQTFKLDTLDNLEEITNKTIIKTLINEHNDAILKILLDISKNKNDRFKRYKFISENKENKEYEIEQSLSNALIEISKLGEI